MRAGGIVIVPGVEGPERRPDSLPLTQAQIESIWREREQPRNDWVVTVRLTWESQYAEPLKKLIECKRIFMQKPKLYRERAGARVSEFLVSVREMIANVISPRTIVGLRLAENFMLRWPEAAKHLLELEGQEPLKVAWHLEPEDAEGLAEVRMQMKSHGY
jgi:hypothetical protein